VVLRRRVDGESTGGELSDGGGDGEADGGIGIVGEGYETLSGGRVGLISFAGEAGDPGTDGGVRIGDEAIEGGVI
jgi:hypothetical protein